MLDENTNNIDLDLLQLLHGLLIEIDEQDELTNLSQDVVNKTLFLKSKRNTHGQVWNERC